MRQFTFLKGASIFNIFCAALMIIPLGFIGVIGVFIKVGEVEILKPFFDLFGDDTSKIIMNFLHKTTDLRLSEHTLREIGIHNQPWLGTVINYFTVGEWFMVVGFTGLSLAVYINIYASINLIKRITLESEGIRKVSRFKMILTCILSIPIAPLAALLMFLGTLFSTRIDTSNQIKNTPYNLNLKNKQNNIRL